MESQVEPDPEPEDEEYSAETVMVGVHPADMAVIITGLREMPGAMTKMARAIEEMAASQKRSPTKVAHTVGILAVGILILVVMGILDGRVRETSRTTQDIAKQTKQLTENVYDCLNYSPEGRPVGECAQETAGVITAFAARLTEQVRCENELRFYITLKQNPQIGVEPAPITDTCKRILEEQGIEVPE